MTRSAFNQSVTALALSLCVAAVVVLALPGQSVARRPNALCPPAGKTHLARGPHACTKSGRTSKSTPRGRAQPTAAGRRPNHTAGKHRTAKRQATRKRSARGRAKSPAAKSLTPALCEDGSAPPLAGNGSFSCDDESEPACENGSRPVTSSDGSHLVCEASGHGGESEALCEDGSSPLPAGNGHFSCDDESEPMCEDGTEPTLSSGQASLVCDVGPSKIGASFESVG